jgi:hypothetical protein
MASKSILFAGIILLVAGIVIRKATGFSIAGLIVILLGVGCKTYYIIGAIRSGLYRPGPEIWLLFVGLALFLGGLYLRGSDFFIDPVYLIGLGLTMKILFVIRFIQLVRHSRQAST